jgi:hypothetical protein
MGICCGFLSGPKEPVKLLQSLAIVMSNGPLSLPCDHRPVHRLPETVPLNSSGGIDPLT